MYQVCIPFRILLHHHSFSPATVAQHVAHQLVVGKVIGSNLGLTPRHDLMLKMVSTATMSDARHK